SAGFETEEPPIPKCRPRFDVVTGVSTGALQAPLVFLDSPFGEAQLQRYYTSYGSSDIITARCPLAIPFSSSTHVPKGLVRLLSSLIDAEFLKKIVEASWTENRTARRLLYVGTVGLTSAEFHMWP